jgi:hypothetical protein
MRRSWLRLCAGTSFIGAALVLGCQHGHRQHESCNTCSAAHAPASLAASELKPVPASSYQPITGERVVVVNEVPADAAKAPKAPEPMVEQTTFVKPSPEDDHSKIRRRSFADISADPCFAHSPEYTSVTGELYYLNARNCWTVRYASVDEEDRYGGSVTLSDMGTMDQFHSGQMVRVEGRIADPESREPSPKFQVQSIHLVR